MAMPQHSASPDLHKLWVLGLGLRFFSSSGDRGKPGDHGSSRGRWKKGVLLNGIYSIWLCLVTPGLDVHGDEGCWVNSVAIIVCGAAGGHWG